MTFNPPSAYTVLAEYTEQRLPHFKNNPLIEALPPPMSEQGLIEALSLMPDFERSQRGWDTAERLMMLETLLNFMVPLQRHAELFRALDSMLRNGYVGRAPRTPEHSQIFQSIYAQQKAGQAYRQVADSRTPQLSTSLIGVSGLGKTTALERWAAHLPKVIFHPEHNLYQIPVLHVEMPSDGKSGKGLGAGILQKIDTLLPGSNYYDLYSGGGRAGADVLIKSAARVMHLHSVGLLIVDEVQNLANSSKGAEVLMTELVSACNVTKVPILFVGTNKAVKVLGIDFRQSRRASGFGIEPWERLLPGTAEDPSEWDGFLQILWQFQWLRKPVELDATLARCMFDCTQGVVDLAIKLFVSAQSRAMLDESERLTPELILNVYANEFRLLHPMLQALREDNYELLCLYDDVAPLNLREHLQNAQLKLRSAKSPLFGVRPKDSTFAPRLAAGLEAMGMEPTTATELVDTVSADHPEANLAQAIGHVAAHIKQPKPVRRHAKSGVVVELPADRFDSRPMDYRRAFAHAKANNVTVLNQLKAFGMAPMLDSVLEI